MAQQVQQFVPQAPVYNAPRRPMWVTHAIIGGVVALVGFALMLTGALASYGIVFLSLGVIYAGAWYVACGLLNACPTTPGDSATGSVPSDVSIR